MPNHVTNNLTISGKDEEVLKCLSEIKGEKEEQYIDFNTFAPIPKELEGTQSPTKIITQEEYDKQEERIAKGELTENEQKWVLSRGLTKELSEQYKKQFGADNWYDWNIQNWGTKWNAYEQYSIKDSYSISFQTAWGTPFNAIQKLSAKYPTLRFDIEYCDEDFGSNVGVYTFKKGVCIEENIPENLSVEAIRMSMEISGDYEYYLVDFLCDLQDDELSDFEDNLVYIAHQEQYLVDEYPVIVLNRLKEFALDEEQYERVAKIDELIKQKEETTK